MAFIFQILSQIFVLVLLLVVENSFSDILRHHMIWMRLQKINEQTHFDNITLTLAQASSYHFCLGLLGLPEKSVIITGVYNIIYIRC